MGFGGDAPQPPPPAAEQQHVRGRAMADEIGFSVGAVARRLGVAPSTLRTWNRRYGIGAREFSPGRHRRHTAEDIIRREHMQRLILRGAAPADAAHAALASAVLPARAPVPDIPASRTGPGHGAGGQRLPPPPAPPPAPPPRPP